MSIDPKPAGGVAAAALAIAVTLGLSGLAHAAGVTMECARADVEKPMWNAPVVFAFEGDQRGVFKVGGVFGDFTVPASRRSVRTRSGATLEMIVGEAKVRLKKMPALSEVEACIDKIPGARAGAAESDAFLNARDQCMRELPAAPSGVDVLAYIDLGLDGEDGYVQFRLTYDAPARPPADKMVIDVFPAKCTLKK